MVQEEMSFKIFLIWSSGSLPVQWSRTIYPTLIKSHHGEYSCEVIWNLDQCFRRRCRLKYFLSGALAAFLFSGVEPFIQLKKKGHHREYSCEVIWNLDQCFRRRCRLKKRFTDDGRRKTDDGGGTHARRRPITISHHEPSAQLSFKQQTRF